MGNEHKSRIASFSNQYPLANKEEIYENYRAVPLSYKSHEIKNFHVIFFHRLLKKLYGEPSEVEIEAVKKLDSGKIAALGREWKYYIFTESQFIIRIETERQHSSIRISHIISDNKKEPSKAEIKAGRKFVNALLQEAVRLKGELLNPKKEFERGEGIQLYLLHNVYLYNYGSAELMLEYSDESEHKLRYEFAYMGEDVKYFADPEKENEFKKYKYGMGMYYAASISYFYMALEGFINLIYHAFLLDEFRDQDFNWEKRLDIDQKIRLMSSLCQGFKNEQIDTNSTIYKNFIRLKKYRNQIFHSKIEDSLKQICLVESGFLYTCDMDLNKGNKEQSFPAHKLYLTRENVITVKSIVDNMIYKIVEKMEDKYKLLVDKFLLKNTEVPFWKDQMGKITLGH